MVYKLHPMAVALYIVKCRCVYPYKTIVLECSEWWGYIVLVNSFSVKSFLTLV